MRKLRLIWAILRGHSVMYRVSVKDLPNGDRVFSTRSEHVVITECNFECARGSNVFGIFPAGP